MASADQILGILYGAARDRRVGDGGQRLLVILLEKTGEDSWVRGTRIRELAVDLGKKERRTRDLLLELDEAGYITRKQVGKGHPSAYRVDCLIPGLQSRGAVACRHDVAASERQDSADPKYGEQSERRQRERSQNVLSVSVLLPGSEEEQAIVETMLALPPPSYDQVSGGNVVQEILRLDDGIDGALTSLRALGKANFLLPKAVKGCFWVKHVHDHRVGGPRFEDRVDSFLDDDILERPNCLASIRAKAQEMLGSEDPYRRRLGDLYKILFGDDNGTETHDDA